MNDTQRIIEQALSLRDPQKESLDILAKIAEQIVFTKDMPLQEALRLIQEVAPSVKDFERAFPCICFAIATGVGKTRLMGAMIAYLHAEKNIKNFMVLAPNLTIYNKLKTDFTPNTSKYVFSGLRAYVGTPQIITGDNYDQLGGLFDNPNDGTIQINIFNISKIDSDKDARGTPRVRRMAEYLGQPYFEYLADKKDLVLFMDEAHRYRANAGMAAINELRPVLGIELTATAKSTGAKGKPFRNIAYEYNLAHAIIAGYVKKPAVVGRSDFDKDLFKNSEELENLKIKDALKVHESIKAELQVYADNKKTKLVKPFVMIIAENIAHAQEIEAKIKSDDFENGRYKDKVIVVNSKQNGELKDEVLQRLLAIEDANEPTEIVIHVNMLGEGWDVNNLYTIVPLRAANSKILVEQSIGRGLRLPFGDLTHVDTLDRLHVIAHDKFADIIKAADEGQLEFQQEYIDKSGNGVTGKQAQNNISELDKKVQSGELIVQKPQAIMPSQQETPPVFTQEINKQIGDTIRDSINDISRYIGNPQELTTDDVQQKIVKLTEDKIRQIHVDNSMLSLEPMLDVKETVKRYTQNFIQLSINIPRIKIGFEQQGDFTFDDFDIDTAPFNGYQPLPQKMIVNEIVDKSKHDEMQAEFVDRYEDMTHYLLVHLIEKPEIAYQKMADLLHKLVTQVIEYITSYSGGEQNTRKILFFYSSELADKILEQMKKHLREAPVKMLIKVDSGYAPITSASYKISVTEGLDDIDFRANVQDKSKIRNMTFTGFDKCLFSKQKFDSVTEKDFAELLERTPDVLKWFKINNDRAREVFNIKYRNVRKQEYCTYLPDFIVETTHAKYMVETKAADNMDDATVQAKKDAAVQWCQIATDFENEHGGKPWYYLLIPDSAIVFDRSFEKLVADCKEK